MNKITLAKSSLSWVFRVVYLTTLVLILASSLSFSQNRSSDFQTIHVKFKEHLRPDRPVNGRTAGIGKVDAVNEKHKAVVVKRIFPDAGVFEDAHRAYGLHLWYEITLAKDVRLKSAIADYKGTEFFDQVEESKPYSFGHVVDNTSTVSSTLPSGSNDPYFASQWHFENNGQTGGTPHADINLLKAWQKETGSPEVIVAVIDGGININHPDLKGALWVNADEIPANDKDDDHNGYIDDIHGYGFGDQTHIIRPSDHATHVAGTIGAVSNNGIGVSGIAGGDGVKGGVRLMSCATFGQFGIMGFEEAMVYAADNGAVISQNSWGGGSTAIEAAIDYFINRAGYDNTAANFSKNIQTGPMAGGIVIFAAGNSNSSDVYRGYPASYDKVIAVGSTDHNDVKSEFSNYGSWVDIWAPGTDVYSTTKNSSYEFFSGTSMACPHVSGAAALIISNLQRPGLKPSEIWNRLRLSSRSINSENPNLWGRLGWGRLDAFVALKEPDGIAPGAIADLHAEDIHSTSLQLNWTASGENNTEGQAAEYEIRYSTDSIFDEPSFQAGILVSNAPTPPLSGEQVVVEINDLLPGTTYHFAVKSIDVFNNISPLSNIINVRTRRLPKPELVTTQLSEQLYTGGISTRAISVKNVGEDADLLIRAGVPQIQSAPLIPPLGAKGRLFAINSSHDTIDELNTTTGEVIHSIPMPEPSSKTVEGLAFDGRYLYYGRSKTIYKIRPETGDVVRTIILNDAAIINGLAWSGHSLYVSKYLWGVYNTAEVDVDNGAVLRTLDTYGELAYFGNSNTLLIANYGRLNVVNIQDGNYVREIPGGAKSIAFSVIDNVIFVSDGSTTINVIRPSDGTVLHTFPYPVTTALAGTEHNYGWLETDEEVISIPPGQTGEVPVTFSSSGLNSGTWTGSVNIVPLNSNSTPLPVPVTLSVVSSSDLETASEIDFGLEYVGFSVDTTIMIENRGFFNLVINSIQSNNAKVTNSISSVILTPGQRIDMNVKVKTDVPGVVDALITITSNDPDEAVLTIPVKATILEAPGMVVSPDSLKATLSSGETITLSISVTNTGGSPLRWNARLTGSDSTIVQSTFTPTQLGTSVDSVHQTELGEFSLRAPSPETMTCLSYDPVGELIYARGLSSNNFYTYDPVADQWTFIGLIPTNFYGQAVYLNGKLYHGGSQLNIYNVQSKSWSSVSFPGAGEAVSITSDDKYVYVAIEKKLYRFDTLSGTWLELAPVPSPLYMSGFAALSYHSGIIFASGSQGITADGNTLFFKYFINSNSWIKSESISGRASLGSAIDISSGRYFVAGSPWASPDQGIQMSILDIREGEWTRTATPFPVGVATGLVFVGKDKFSGIYFIQGDGNKFGYYETASAPNWLTVTPTASNLPAGETQTISVTLSAKGLFGGMYRGNVQVYSEHPVIKKNLPLELKVLGTSDIALSKTSEDIGNVVLEDERGTWLTVKNKGTLELVIDNVSISSPDFTITQTTFVIPVGESLTLNAYFKPTSVGKQTCILTFHSNDPNKSELQFELSGTGVHPAQLQVPTDTIKVTLFTGGNVNKKFSVHNTGNGNTQYLTVWGNKSWITVDSAGWAVNIAAHQAREFEAGISAEGLSQGIYNGVLMVIDYRDPSDAYYQIPVRMQVISAPHLFSTRDSLDFNDQFINGQYDSTFQIKNTGVLPLLISSIESDNSAFAVTVNGPLNLNLNESVTITVRFSPTPTSAQTGTITIISNDPDGAVTIIPVKGRGVYPPQLELSTTELHVSAFINESTTDDITIFNNGGSTLKWQFENVSNPQPTAAGDFTSKANVPTDDGYPIAFTGLAQDPASGLVYAQYMWDRALYTYNPQSNNWAEIGYMPAVGDKKNAGAVILNSKLYCVYAEDDKTIYIYDLILRNQTSKPNKLGFGSATITTDGVLLYLAGGGKFVSYNPKNNAWVDLPTPNFNLDGMGGLSYLNGTIYAHSVNGNFAKYTIATGVWDNLVPLPDQVSLGSTVDPVKNRYYAHGTNYLYEYDVAANVWTVLYFSLFEIGDGGLSFVTKPGYEGVYFTQSKAGRGFVRYEPKSEWTWLRSSQVIGDIDAMDDHTVGLNCNALSLAPGVYHGNINLTTNDPRHLALDIPVTFKVKRSTPTIEIPAMIADTVGRSTPSHLYLVIKNEGRELLEWNLTNTLPSWLAVNKTTGNISGESADSIEVTFSPGMFPIASVADYNLEINSNDPTISKSSTRLMLTLQNHRPVVSALIADQVLSSDQLEIPLLQHFSDSDSDVLDFSVSSNTALISVHVVDSKLFISPIKSGVSAVTVTATDPYNSSVTYTFDVDNLITGFESLSREQALTASPNPFKRKIKIHFEGLELDKVSLVLFDVTGKAVWKSAEFDSRTQNELEIDTANLPSGLYTCMLFARNKLMDSIRVVKD